MADAKKKPGPAEARVGLRGDWEMAVASALKKQRPPEGWPKPETKKRAAKK